MCRETRLNITYEVKNPAKNILMRIYGWREHLGARTNRCSVCCAWSQAKNHNSGHIVSQRTLWLCWRCSVRSLPGYICAWNPNTFSLLSLVSVGKWNLFSTPILTGYCSLRFFFYFIYILYRGKKKNTPCIHTHFSLILNCNCGQCFWD